MTGSARERLDVLCGVRKLKRREVWREGGARSRGIGGPADFLCFMLEAFLKIFGYVGALGSHLASKMSQDRVKMLQDRAKMTPDGST